MAKQKNLTATVSIGGVEYGAGGATIIVSSWGLETPDEELDTTVFGDSVRKRESGLGDGTLSLGFKLDDDLTTWGTLYALKGTEVAIAIQAQNAAIAAANPELQFSVLWANPPMPGGDVGTLNEPSASFPLTTAVTVDTTP
jgi:hypothetical protein